MEKYSRVETSKADDNIMQNEIRVTTQGKMRRYISYATSLLQENKCQEITLKAMGKAINKTVAIAEIIKRRIPNLHQITEIDSTDIKETYAPQEEGLDSVETTRHVSSILISLYTQTPDTSAIGYQPPIPDTEVRTSVAPLRGGIAFTNRRGGRSRGRGGRRGRGRRGGRGRSYSNSVRATGGRNESENRGENNNNNETQISEPRSNPQPAAPPPTANTAPVPLIPLARQPISNEGGNTPEGQRGPAGRRGGGRGRGGGRRRGGGRFGGRGFNRGRSTTPQGPK